MALTGKEELYASTRNHGRATVTAAELASLAATDAPLATTTTAGVVKKAAAQTTFNGADVAGINTQLNAWYAKLQAAGIVT